MAWFKRRAARGLSFELKAEDVSPAPVVRAADPFGVGPAETCGRVWIAPRSSPADVPFWVSGTIYRQAELAKVGSGRRLFRLERDPTNVHDADAVKVIADGVHIGWITAKNSGRYTEVIKPVEAQGLTVHVHGQIRKQGNQHSSKWVALIDCAFPNDWPV